MSGQAPGERWLATSRRKRLSRYAATAAIILSLFAVAIVLGNVAAGVPPQSDENGWAHLFQLAMGLQVPLLLLFLATADWSERRSTLLLLASQLIAASAAIAAVAWSGY